MHRKVAGQYTHSADLLIKITAGLIMYSFILWHNCNTYVVLRISSNILCSYGYCDAAALLYYCLHLYFLLA